jgi:uncharacterized protein YodC (DUF2158 family)
MQVELKPGDVVTLKSGGPPMTISSITQETLEASVVWFDDGRYLERKLPLATLIICSPSRDAGSRYPQRLALRA